jgi:ribosomal protein S18 acetylase RimI-like enzyme
MEDAIIYRPMNPNEVNDVGGLVSRVFSEFVAPEYSLEGIQEFQRYIQPAAFLARLQANHFSLISVERDKIVGMIEVRNHNHISLLFVAPEFHRCGIAKELWHRALQICQATRPELTEISVNSSSYAVPIYEKFGFHQSGDRQIRNGIAFIPMVLKLSKQGGEHQA